MQWAIGRLLKITVTTVRVGGDKMSFLRSFAMFDFGAVFENVLAGLQESFAGVIMHFITSLLSSILSGVLPGA